MEPTAAFQYRTPAAVSGGAPRLGTVGAVRQSWTIDDMSARQMEAGIMASEEHDEVGRLFVNLLDWQETQTVASWSLAEAEHVLEVVDELPTGADY